MKSIIVGERKIFVPTSAERIWRLLGKVIFSSLPEMEHIEILDENNFKAILRTKILGTELALRVKGEIVDIVPPEKLAVKLSLSGPGIFSEVEQRVSLAINSAGKEKTIIDCKATVEKINRLSRVFLVGQIKKFAQATFEAMERRLQELV